MTPLSGEKKRTRPKQGQGGWLDSAATEGAGALLELLIEGLARMAGKVLAALFEALL